MILFQNGRSLLEMEQSMKEFQDNLQRLNISVRNLVEDGDRKQENILVSLMRCILRLRSVKLLCRAVVT